MFWVCNRLLDTIRSNLQLVWQEVRELPQGFGPVLPLTPRHQPCDRGCTRGYAARDSRAVSGSVGGYAWRLPELPGKSLCCATGLGKGLPGLWGPGLAAGSRHGPGICQQPAAVAVSCLWAAASLRGFYFHLISPHGFLWPFWQPL